MKLSELKEINSSFDRERKQYACMISYYAAKEGAADSLALFEICVELAKNTDFEMEKTLDGEWVIDTEWARCNAIELIRNILGKENENANKI